MDTSLPFVGAQEFDQVIQSDKVVVVEFWASWCGPSQEMAPHIEALAKEYAEQASVVRVNVDENRKLAKRLGVKNIPVILFFEKGRTLDRLDGLVAKETLVQRLTDMLETETPEDKSFALEEAEQMLKQGLLTEEAYQETRKQILQE